MNPNDGRTTGWFQRAESLDSKAIRVGMAWVKNALQELTYGRHALMWWWEAAEESRGFTLHLVGGTDGRLASKTFSAAVLSRCATNARLGSAVRQRLKVLLGDVTRSTSREAAPVA